MNKDEYAIWMRQTLADAEYAQREQRAPDRVRYGILFLNILALIILMALA